MWKHPVKKFTFIIRNVPDQYETQQIYDKTILENVETLESVLDCYKKQQMRDKAVDNYHHASKLVPDCFITQKYVIKLSILIITQHKLFLIAIRLNKCVIKLFNKCFLAFIYIPDQSKTQEMCDRVVSEDPFSIFYCPDKYQRMCSETVDDSLAVLSFMLDWFVTNKMNRKLLTALYGDDNILYFDENSDDAIFSFNEMSILWCRF